MKWEFIQVKKGIAAWQDGAKTIPHFVSEENAMPWGSDDFNKTFMLQRNPAA